MPTGGPEADQANAVVEVVRRTLGDNVQAIYLYGSAVAGRLKPASDLDFLAVISEPTNGTQRRSLVDGLEPISRRGARPQKWRPVELTLVVASDIKPWRFPPRTDFQYGEWLRDRFDAGHLEPERPDNPDLALLIAMARENGRALVGPAPTDLLPDLPKADLRTALLGVVPDLMADVDTDTANVLLTLARVLHTLETGDFASKDVAADWSLNRLKPGQRQTLEHARDVYLCRTADDWTDLHDEARVAAGRLEAEIRQHAER